ncbi:hypothetical protein KA036_02290 [Candidatus Gracilibacteria bacterium]|nr:hypothetical protein [Candidatus Gracilibacteria bacterium]
MDLAQIPKLHSYDQQNALYKEAYLVFEEGGEKPAEAEAVAPESPKGEVEAPKASPERPKDELEMEQIMKSIFEGMGLESLFGVFSGFVDDITKYLRDSKDPFSKAVYELLVSEQNRVKPTATPTPAEGEVAPEGEKKEEEKAGEGVNVDTLLGDISSENSLSEKAKKSLKKIAESVSDQNLKGKASNLVKSINDEKNAKELNEQIAKELNEQIDTLYTENKLFGLVPKEHLEFQFADGYDKTKTAKFVEGWRSKLTGDEFNVFKLVLAGYARISALQKKKKPEAKVDDTPEASKTPNTIDPESLKSLQCKTIEATENNPKSVHFNFIDKNNNSIPCSLLLAADIGQRTISSEKTADAASLLQVGDNVYKIEANSVDGPFVAFSAAVFNPEGTNVTLTAGAPGGGIFAPLAPQKPGTPLPLGNLETFIANLANNKPSSENLDVNDADGNKQKLIFTKIS